jgi:hypothetical protein
MPFTRQLDLDAEAEATLGALSETLAGIPGLATVRKLGDVHHISLAIYDDPPLEQFVPALAAFAETLTPLEVRLASIGLFADITNVVFLGVVVTEALLASHRRAHAALGAFREACWEHYLPEAWFPHVSLALNATNAAAQAATATLLAQRAPSTVRIEGLRLIRFGPVHSVYQRALI